MSLPAVLELEADCSSVSEQVPVPPSVPQVQMPDRAGVFVRLPTVRTVTTRIEVVGRLQPLPLPELED